MSDYVVPGFRFGSATAGLKESGGPDMALIVADQPAAAAGVFTTNRVAAPSVRLTRARLRAGRAQAVIVNSGNANVATGEHGERATREITAALAQELRIDPELVLMSSTGIIGRRLPTERMKETLPSLIVGLRPDGLPSFARAIMTTDTRAKLVQREGTVGGARVRVAACAKGAGMIAPNMATMLAYIVTDAAAEADALQDILRAALPSTFNAITIDGDMSTSDTVLLLASGRAGNRKAADGNKEEDELASIVTKVMETLALEIVRDGEGATKFVTVRVAGAPTDECARAIARAIAESVLVKTMLFGGLANWGRVLAAAGRAGPGADFDPDL
ncbi:MAG: bifunctional glutamate N-acetyltransferase/amino-acid acetyltransferase ArgJ, partial [Candidatus Methylomirabilis sp.]|nr:bifunctional glutamate N-acetyltransferase/amino-acid acetyltransferase ArgJ [Deltaproteobacteria bacterium]